MTTEVGIEAINVWAGAACLDVRELAVHRGLDMRRFDNLLMQEKAVALPYEDAVTYAVNAAMPLVQDLAPPARDRIELVLTCSESGVDFGKSLSTYVHHYLGLNRNCRLLELKQACYAGTAGLQMAAQFILSGASPGAKALVIATDVTRFAIEEGMDVRSQDWAYAEPSSGAGAVALLVSSAPEVLQLDVGANGYYGFEVMDACRPEPDGEAGDPDLSLMSYLDCCEQTFIEYCKRVRGADYRTTFDYLAFHTPFGGMVRGAHRTMMRKFAAADVAEIDADFSRRVQPGLKYCQRIGNIMTGTALLSLASTIDHADLAAPKRIGAFSYGSGCCSEFYSGVATQRSQQVLRRAGIEAQLQARHRLSIPEYEAVLRANAGIRFGTRNAVINRAGLPVARATAHSKGTLALSEIREFHRRYEWAP